MHLIHWILLIIHALLGLFAGGHALLFKRDSKAALGWIAVWFLFPLLGPLLYFLLGINRIRTRARKLHNLFSFQFEDNYPSPEQELPPMAADSGIHPQLMEIVRISSAVTHCPIVGGNTVELLQNGEQAYPAMLAARMQPVEAMRAEQ